MVLVFIFLLLFFSLSNRKQKEEQWTCKGTRFLFPFGNKERTEAIGREEGFAEAWGGSTDKEPTPLSFPIHWNRKRKEQGLHPPLVLPFLCFCHIKGNRRREGREKKRGETTRIAFVLGRAKKRIEERWIKERERQNKAQRRWHSSLSILSPSSLPALFLFEIRKQKGRTMRRRRGRKGTERIGR